MPGAVFLADEEGEIEFRTIEEEDVEFLQETLNDPHVRRTTKTVAPITRQQEREWVNSIGEDDSVQLLICVDDRPVGNITLFPPNEIWGVAEIAYMIAPDEWGNGYATDAVDRLCAYAFDERRLSKVFARVFSTNEASCRVLEKVGFVKEGVFRKEVYLGGERIDMYRYGLVKDE